MNNLVTFLLWVAVWVFVDRFGGMIEFVTVSFVVFAAFTLIAIAVNLVTHAIDPP